VTDVAIIQAKFCEFTYDNVGESGPGWLFHHSQKTNEQKMPHCGGFGQNSNTTRTYTHGPRYISCDCLENKH